MTEKDPQKIADILAGTEYEGFGLLRRLRMRQGTDRQIIQIPTKIHNNLAALNRIREEYGFESLPDEKTLQEKLLNEAQEKSTRGWLLGGQKNRTARLT